MVHLRSAVWTLGALVTAFAGPGCTHGRGSAPITVYFLEGEKLAPIHRDVPSSRMPRALLESLLAGPSPHELRRGVSTEVPRDTKLLDLSIREETAFVDLSHQIAEGGGSLSMRARLAQLVFTATELPGVERMRLLIDGEPVPYLGGEGVLTEEPLTRERFDEFAPLIAPPVYGPAPRREPS